MGQIIAGTCIAIVYKWDMALIAIGIAFGVVVPACTVQMRTIQGRSQLLADAYGRAGGFAGEVLASIRTVASLSMEGGVLERYDSGLETAMRVAINTNGKIALCSATIVTCLYYLPGLVTLYAVVNIHKEMVRSTIPFQDDQVRQRLQGGSSSSLCLPSSNSSPPCAPTPRLHRTAFLPARLARAH